MQRETADAGRCASGLRQIKGFAEADAERLVAARGAGYRDPADLWRRSGLGRGALERLAEADALCSVGLDRRHALWALKGLGEPPLPLFAVAEALRPIRAKLAPHRSCRGCRSASMWSRIMRASALA